MTTPRPTRIEVDDRIRVRPDLADSVGRATEYLLSQVGEDLPPGDVVWSFADADGKLLQISLTDSANTNPGMTVQRNFWAKWILDPVNSKLCVTEVWIELLNRRLDQQVARVNAGLAELERAEHDGGQIAH